MNVISCDVGWKGATKRNAVAIATDSRQIDFVKSGLDDDHLVALVREWAVPQSLILLDVPIEGCDNLEGPRRPIERVLQRYIALYPASMAGKRGKQLKEILLQAIHTEVRGSVIVKEMYPHAVYKFLWVAKRKGKLAKVQLGEWQSVLDQDFTPSRSPPKYKGNIEYNRRLAGMQKLYTFLTQCLDLRFSRPLDSPHRSSARSRLELLADQYDACLGGVVGLHCVAGNPYALIAGDEHQGEMLLLADMWLKERLEECGISMKRLC